jgi:hypothetical protein
MGRERREVENETRIVIDMPRALARLANTLLDYAPLPSSISLQQSHNIP